MLDAMEELEGERDELKGRVAELVESEEKSWQVVAKLRVDLETTHRLRVRIAELEAAQQPRSMADAPDDGRDILVKVSIPERKGGGYWRIAYSLKPYVAQFPTHWRSGGSEYRPDQFTGWLPLPAQQTRTNSEAPRLAQFERFARYITIGRDHYHHSRGQCCKGECDGAPQCLVCDAEDLLAGEGAYARPPTASDAPARKETP